MGRAQQRRGQEVPVQLFRENNLPHIKARSRQGCRCRGRLLGQVFSLEGRTAARQVPDPASELSTHGAGL